MGYANYELMENFFNPWYSMLYNELPHAGGSGDPDMPGEMAWCDITMIGGGIDGSRVESC